MDRKKAQNAWLKLENIAHILYIHIYVHRNVHENISIYIFT